MIQIFRIKKKACPQCSNFSLPDPVNTPAVLVPTCTGNTQLDIKQSDMCVRMAMAITFFWKTNICFQENYKDDQNGLIHSENWRLWMFITGGVRAEITVVSRTFWLQIIGSKHFKRSRYQFFLQSSRQIWW